MAAAVMLVLFLVVMMAAAAMLLVVMMMVVMVFLLQLGQFRCQRSLSLHSLDQLLAGQVIPGSGNHSCLGIMLPQQCNGSIQLGLGNSIGTGKDDGVSGLHLVIVEFAEVLHVKLDLAGISHCNSVSQLHIMAGDLLHGADHIGQLAHAGGFNDDPVGMVLGDDLLQRLAEITHQTAANTAGIHLGDVDAGFLQETAVNTDLTEFVFNQHQFLALIAFRDHFLD